MVSVAGATHHGVRVLVTVGVLGPASTLVGDARPAHPALPPTLIVLTGVLVACLAPGRPWRATRAGRRAVRRVEAGEFAECWRER